MSYQIKNTIKNKTLLNYIPHAINSNTYKPISSSDPHLIEFKKKLFGGKEYDFVLLLNSRNINRKRISNAILAYRQFCDNLTKEEAMRCLFVIHSELVLDSGTNNISVKEALCPNYNIMFSPGKLSPIDMNNLYNCADITVCASSSEGFGLSIAESIMAGTPVSATVSGGLQDFANFRDENNNPIEFNGDWGSNHDGKYKKCGRWFYPVFPATRYIQGSPMTPYIMDSITDWSDIADSFMYWYMTPNKTRKQYGMEGRRFMMENFSDKVVGQKFIDSMEFVFKHWTKPKSFGVYSIKDYVGNTMTRGKLGFEIPKIDKEEIKRKIELNATL